MEHVARHEVRAGAPYLGLAVVVEVEHPGVFEEATDHRAHPDIFGDAGQARAQAAHAADDQVALDAGLGGAVERLDQLGFGQRVALDDDMGALALARVACLPLDHFDDPFVQGEGGVQQLLDLAGAAHAGQLLEHLVHVGAQHRVRGEQAVVGVELGRLGVIVAGAEMSVVAQRALLAAHDVHHLGVGLVGHHPVDDDGAGLLQA